MNQKLELLSPSGDIDRLKLAVKFGADAIYIGGEMFGMRTNPSNFNADQLKQAVELVHSAGKRLYLTCNTLPRNNELDYLPDYLKYVESIGIDALIIADMGVLALAKKYAPNTASIVQAILDFLVLPPVCSSPEPKIIFLSSPISIAISDKIASETRIERIFDSSPSSNAGYLLYKSLDERSFKTASPRNSILS